MSRWDEARAEMVKKSYDRDVEYRIGHLIKCDEFIFTKVEDEGLVYSMWCTYMPDEADLEDYEDIACSDDLYRMVLEAFNRTVIADME